jgi:hypothetical protein
MRDPNDPYSPGNLSWNWSRGGPKSRPFSGRIFRGPRLPPPPGPPPKPSKAQREQEERAEARAERLHLAGLTNAAVIIMGVLLGVMVIVLVFVAVSHH